MTELSKKLIERLQGHYASPHHGGCQDCYGLVMDDAAAEIARLTAALSHSVTALKCARCQLVTLGGDIDYGDQIQIAVLEVIDAALSISEPVK